MTSLTEAKMSKDLTDFIFKTPSISEKILTWALRGLASLIIVDFLNRKLLKLPYDIINNHFKNIISSTFLLVILVNVTFKLSRFLFNSKNLSKIEIKERNYQIKLHFISLLSAIYLIIFATAAILSQKSHIVSFISDYKPYFLIVFSVYLISYIYIIYKLFKSSDELFVIDQLWANFIAIWFYAILFPAWWLLSEFNFLNEPNGWIIYALTMTVGLAVYIYRQYRSGNI